MLQPHDVDLWLVKHDRSDNWPIWDWSSLTLSRGKQPTGQITISVPSDAWWISASSLLTGTAQPGAAYLLEGSIRGTLIQPTRIDNLKMRRGYNGAELTLSANALWADMLKDRVVFDSGTGKAESITGRADDVGREYLRRQLVGATATVPTNYPHGSRATFKSLTAAIGADTASHATTITYDVDSGKNLLEWALEYAAKYNLRWTIALSGSTITFDVATPYSAVDKKIATTGKLWTPGLSTLEEWAEVFDFSSLRNTVLVGDGTTRSWLHDGTSVSDFGTKEEVGKITSGGGLATVAMLGAEAAALLAMKDGERRIEIVPAEMDWMRFGDDWVAAASVTASEYGTWLREAELEVTEVTLDWSAGSEPRFKVAVGQVRRDLLKEAWELPGPPGGFQGGSRFFDRNV